jgi:Flp pilus assembly pilin Flp
MLHPKFFDDSGSSSLEYTLLIGLFVAPILAASQQLVTEQLRQNALDAIAQTVARDFSVHQSQSRVKILSNQLSLDAGISANLLYVDLTCTPAPSCATLPSGGDGNSTVQVDVGYRDQKAHALQVLDEQGSVLPLMLGCLAFAFALVLAGVNVQAATIYDQRASSLARFLVHYEASKPTAGGPTNLTAFANEISKKLMFSTQAVQSAWIENTDSRTLTAKVCLGYSSPLDVFSLPVSRACAAASIRRSD